MKTLSALAIAIAIAACLVACANGRVNRDGSAPPSPITANYVHAGSLVYAGDNAFDEYSQELCPTIGAFIKWASRPSPKHMYRCEAIKHGVPLVITSIESTPREYRRLGFSAFVKLRTLDAKLQGYSAIEYIEPPVPPGTVLRIHGDWATDVGLGTSETCKKQFDLGTEALVKVVSFHPQNVNCTLFVRVIAGDFKGHTGWTSPAAALLEPGSGGIYGPVLPTF